MANATPPNSRRPARGGREAGAAIEKNPVEARQGRPGARVLIILVASLAILAIVYIVLQSYFGATPHQPR
jgi:hypothetical protein